MELSNKSSPNERSFSQMSVKYRPSVGQVVVKYQPDVSRHACRLMSVNMPVESRSSL